MLSSASMTGGLKSRTAWGAATLLMAMTANAQDRTQARSMVISRQGIVATSQTLASQAGAQILARGGSVRTLETRFEGILQRALKGVISA